MLDHGIHVRLRSCCDESQQPGCLYRQLSVAVAPKHCCEPPGKAAQIKEVPNLQSIDYSEALYWRRSLIICIVTAPACMTQRWNLYATGGCVLGINMSLKFPLRATHLRGAAEEDVCESPCCAGGRLRAPDSVLFAAAQQQAAQGQHDAIGSQHLACILPLSRKIACAEQTVHQISVMIQFETALRLSQCSGMSIQDIDSVGPDAKSVGKER